jgi:hypothetical protein
MPTSTRISGVRERVSFLAYAGWVESLESGSLRSALWPAMRWTMSGVRRTT